MKKSISIIFIVLRLMLGGVMIAGGIGKFLKPLPSPTEILQKAESYTSFGSGLKRTCNWFVKNYPNVRGMI